MKGILWIFTTNKKSSFPVLREGGPQGRKGNTQHVKNTTTHNNQGRHLERSERSPEPMQAASSERHYNTATPQEISPYSRNDDHFSAQQNTTKRKSLLLALRRGRRGWSHATRSKNTTIHNNNICIKSILTLCHKQYPLIGSFVVKRINLSL